MLSFDIITLALLIAFNRHAWEGPITITPMGHDDEQAMSLFSCDGCGETSFGVTDADAQDAMNQANEQSQTLFGVQGDELGVTLQSGLDTNAESVLSVVAPYLEDRRAQGMNDKTFVLETIKIVLGPWITASEENLFQARTWLGDAGIEQLGVVL